MKIIYWRWKDQKTVNKSYIQEDLGNILELTSRDFYTAYPERLLKNEIEVIEPLRSNHETTG